MGVWIWPSLKKEANETKPLCQRFLCTMGLYKVTLGRQSRAMSVATSEGVICSGLVTVSMQDD